MLTITANTFENIDPKFHNDPTNILGDIKIFHIFQLNYSIYKFFAYSGFKC